MAETVVVAGTKDRKHRSPAYPFISLQKALERARVFYSHEKRHAAPVPTAIKHWGFAEKSSGGQQTIGALKQFALLADDGIGADRRVKLTDLALRILLDEVKDSTERAAALREAALAPKLFAEMVAKWGADLPSDDNIRTFLLRDKGFNDDVLNVVIRAFKETLSYANIGKPDKIGGSGNDNGDSPKITVGDYIQWESQGALQFPAPKRVVGLSDDGEFVFVDGETTGIPMQQVEKADPPATPPRVPPLAPPAMRPMPGMAREVFSLEDGEAVLQWPTTLNAEGVQELEDWLTLVVKKLKRLKAKQGAETQT